MRKIQTEINRNKKTKEYYSLIGFVALFVVMILRCFGKLNNVALCTAVVTIILIVAIVHKVCNKEIKKLEEKKAKGKEYV